MTTEEIDKHRAFVDKATGYRVFRFKFSIRVEEPSKAADSFGYFHDMEQLVVDSDKDAALAFLKQWFSMSPGHHVEGVKVEDLGPTIVRIK